MNEIDPSDSVFFLLRLAGSFVDVAHVSEMLSLKPLEITGREIDKTCYWVYQEKYPYRHNIGELIREFVEKMSQKEDLLTVLSKQMEIGFFTVIYTSQTPAVVWSPEVVAFFARLKASIECEFYALPEKL